MRFGSEEWFETLNDATSFPATCAFYYCKRKNVIMVRKVESKAKPENVQFKLIAPSALYFQPKDTAVIQVKSIQSDKEYYEELLRLKEIWDVEFI